MVKPIIGAGLHTYGKNDYQGLLAWINAGCKVFDVADLYGEQPGDAERLIGALPDDIRKKLVIVTKAGRNFYPYSGPWRKLPRKLLTGICDDFRPHYLQFALEQSLKRMKVDRVHYFILHNPTVEEFDNFWLLGAVRTVIRDKAINLGISVWSIKDAFIALRRGWDAVEIAIPRNIGYTWQEVTDLRKQFPTALIFIKEPLLRSAISHPQAIRRRMRELLAFPVNAIFIGSKNTGHIKQHMRKDYADARSKTTELL